MDAKKRTLDDIIKEYKPYEVDFVIPKSEGDIRMYMDLYLMYESEDVEWHEVHAVIVEYFNDLLRKYKDKKISDTELLEMLNFPEVQSIGFGHCKEGVKGSGSRNERASLIKKAVFDNPDIQEFGINALANISIQIEGIGPDLLSDMVGNFALFNLIKYNQEQIETYSLKTMKVSLPRGLDFKTMSWKPALKIELPYFENGEYRLLVPRHIVRKMPILSPSEFYNGFLKYVLQDEETARLKILSVIGKEPKVKIKDIENRLEKKYGSTHFASRAIAKENPELVLEYVDNPHKYNSKRKPKKPNIDWKVYISSLQKLGTGTRLSKKYSEVLLRIFTVIYGNNLQYGKLEKISNDKIYRYDLVYTNTSQTSFFKAVQNHQIKAGLLIIEAKNYGSTDVGNKEFNQGLAYTLKDRRELVFLLQRDSVDKKDVDRAKALYLRQGCVVMPLGDDDLIQLINQRMNSEEDFDSFLVPRLSEILSA